MQKHEFEKYTNEYNVIPVFKEYYADTITPVQALRLLKEEYDDVFLLESAEHSGIRGRYSFLGYAPKEMLTAMDDFFVKQHPGHLQISRLREESPSEQLRETITEYRSPRIEGLPSFTGGYVGYFSYEYFQFKEPTLQFENEDSMDFPVFRLNRFDDLIIFDHFKDKLILLSNVFTDNPNDSYEKALERLERIRKLLTSTPKEKFACKITESFKPVYSKERYCSLVERAKSYIVDGDIFQVVPSNRISGKIEGSLLPAYRVMRSDNPSPYMYYIKNEDEEIAGASPETLIRLEGKDISTFPIAGSRPRGSTPEEDHALEEELLHDEKELAEHNMLVDLGRNDIGQVAEMNTVEVQDYLNVQKYSKIMHLTSKVTGKLMPEKVGLDALTAVLPAGTLSGAPKIRACEIIEELEAYRRGPYGGAIGYFAFNGDMDFCIAIRSAFKKGENTYVQSGGGIVYDSHPESEYIETVNKAAAVVEAIERGENLDYDINN